MTPTKEVPTWPELVERMADILGQHHDRKELRERDDEDADLWRVATGDILRDAGLTPEILEDARAVAWVEERDALMSRERKEGWYLETHDFLAGGARTLREAVAKAKEADHG